MADETNTVDMHIDALVAQYIEGVNKSSIEIGYGPIPDHYLDLAADAFRKGWDAAIKSSSVQKTEPIPIVDLTAEELKIHGDAVKSLFDRHAINTVQGLPECPSYIAHPQSVWFEDEDEDN